MNRDLDPIRRRSEELVRRNLGSRASRERARRKVERGAKSVLRRVRNGALTVVGLFALLIVLSIAAGGLGLAWFIAIPTVFLAALIVMVWPSRRRAQAPRTIDGGTVVRLDALAVQAEDYLLDRSRALPHQAGPTLDRIVERLRDLEPALAAVSTETAVGGEAQRLIGQHLPGLIDNYLSLPPSERGFDGKNSARLAESLGIVADELDHLCERVGEERRTGFETERRFLETRYGDGDRMSLDKPA